MGAVAEITSESQHPLYRQQRDGISLSEAWKIVHHYESKP
jgi:hypothetical protein